MRTRNIILAPMGRAIPASVTYYPAEFSVGQALPPPPPLNSVNIIGWNADVDAPVDLSFEQFTVTRSHPTPTGQVNYSDPLLLTKRVRLPYPDELTFTASTVAMSRAVYGTDALDGAVNNSTLASPKPNGQLLMPRYPLVGNSVLISVAAFHKDARLGRQVASVEVEIFDAATSTLQQSIVIDDTRVSTVCDDAHPVKAFEQDIDITALADQLYYIEINIYPWTGNASTVRSTQDTPVRRDFKRVYFTKNLARFTDPPIAYVNSAGDDATGVWSTTPATAQANKFATPKAAMEAIALATDTGGVADGCILYVDDGTYTLDALAFNKTMPANSAALTIKRSPQSTNRASVILEFGGSAFDPHMGINADRNASTLNASIAEAVINFDDVTLERTGSSNFARSATGTATIPMLYQFINVTGNNNAETARWFNPSDVSVGIFGLVFNTTVGSSALLGGASSVEYNILRGIVCDDIQGSGFDAFSMAGCSLSNSGSAVVAEPTDGMIVHSCSFPKCSNSLFQANWDSSVIVERFHFLNVLGEYISTVTTNVAASLGGSSGSTNGMTVHHCTFIGAKNAFRFNVGYDNQNSVANNEQTHTNLSIVGLACSQLNIKGDLWRQDAAGADGTFALAHGVDCEGNLTIYSANAPLTEHPDFFGLNSHLGSSPSIPDFTEAELFTNHQAATAPNEVFTAGAGGGDYTPATGSPLFNRVKTRLVYDVDLAGAARTLPSPAGALV